MGIARSAARSALEALQFRGAVDRARDLMHPVRPVPWRIALRAPQLEEALSTTDLGMFDEWIETAYPDYRMQQQPSALSRRVLPRARLVQQVKR